MDISITVSKFKYNCKKTSHISNNLILLVKYLYVKHKKLYNYSAEGSCVSVFS